MLFFQVFGQEIKAWGCSEKQLQKAADHALVFRRRPFLDCNSLFWILKGKGSDNGAEEDTDYPDNG